MNIKNTFRNLCLALFLMAMCASCKKSNDLTIPPGAVHFMRPASGTYFITASGGAFKIPIGVSTVSAQDRTVNISVNSPTGAIEGTQFTLSSHTITIPAGQSVDSIALNGIFSAYPVGRRDTLIFTITGGDLPTLVGSEVYTLVLQKYCDVDLNTLLGDYANTYDKDPKAYGPYTVTVVSATATGPTSAALVIKNLGDYYFGPFGPGDLTYDTGVTVNIDWSDPANFFTNFPTQSLGSIPPYGVSTSSAAGKGTFSSCDNTISVSYTTNVAAGSFGTVVTVLKR